jgi:hypothetical protein
MCLVEAFKVYKVTAEEKGLFDKNLPVFRSGTGGAWPKRAFQMQLEKIVGRTGLVKGKGKLSVIVLGEVFLLLWPPSCLRRRRQ